MPLILRVSINQFCNFLLDALTPGTELRNGDDSTRWISRCNPPHYPSGFISGVSNFVWKDSLSTSTKNRQKFRSRWLLEAIVERRARDVNIVICFSFSPPIRLGVEMRHRQLGSFVSNSGWCECDCAPARSQCSQETSLMYAFALSLSWMAHDPSQMWVIGSGTRRERSVRCRFNVRGRLKK